jgi:hypothetical protein
MEKMLVELRHGNNFIENLDLKNVGEEKQKSKL